MNDREAKRLIRGRDPPESTTTRVAYTWGPMNNRTFVRAADTAKATRSKEQFQRPASSKGGYFGPVSLTPPGPAGTLFRAIAETCRDRRQSRDATGRHRPSPAIAL